MRVTVYTRPGSVAGDLVLHLLDALAPAYSLEVTRVNILGNAHLLAKYGGKEPVVKIEGGTLGTLEGPIKEAQLRVQLEIAHRALEPHTWARSVLVEQGHEGQQGEWREPLIDRAASYVGSHWLRFVSIAMSVYVGLPWLAPIFAALDWWALADAIYGAYAFT
jgi:hypothetical protein